jgi:hypothetical protein
MDFAPFYKGAPDDLCPPEGVRQAQTRRKTGNDRSADVTDAGDGSVTDCPAERGVRRGAPR